jgi:hypothetical protein
VAAIGGENSITHCPGAWYALGTVTCTGVTRSTVVHLVPPPPGCEYQQTPDSSQTSAVGGSEIGGTPQASVIGGSP